MCLEVLKVLSSIVWGVNILDGVVIDGPGMHDFTWHGSAIDMHRDDLHGFEGVFLLVSDKLHVDLDVGDFHPVLAKVLAFPVNVHLKRSTCIL